MKRLIIAVILFGMVFNTFALELSELIKADTNSSVLELLDDTEDYDTEDYDAGFDWVVIPELDTEPEPVELPNREFYEEKEKDTLQMFSRILNKVKDILQKQEQK